MARRAACAIRRLEHRRGRCRRRRAAACSASRRLSASATSRRSSIAPAAICFPIPGESRRRPLVWAISTAHRARQAARSSRTPRLSGRGCLRPRRRRGEDAPRRRLRACRAQAGCGARTQPPIAGRPDPARLRRRMASLAEDDQRPGGAHDRERPEQSHLRPELGLHRRDQQRAEKADRDRVDPPATRGLGRGAGSVIMNERKMNTSGRGDRAPSRSSRPRPGRGASSPRTRGRSARGCRERPRT